MQRVPPWAGLMLLAGCSLGEPEVEFVATPLTAAEADAWSQAGIRSAHHEITVRRIIEVAGPCRVFDADAVRMTDEVTLRVSARLDEEDCEAPDAQRFGYLAVIRGLKPGRYQLRVLHAYADPRRRSEVVLEHPVMVE